MAEPWYPGATRDPGVAAGYTRGQTTPVSVVAHETIGRDSSSIGRDQGLFQFLARRNGEIVQYSEVDSVCWHAGQPYNLRGPGIEVEYLPGVDDDVFTDAARASVSALIHWLSSEWGIPLDYYDDPSNRLADWNGFISHRAVTSDAALHYDYWPQSDWDSMVASAPVPPTLPKGSRMLPKLLQAPGDPSIYVYDPNANTITHVPSPDSLAAIQADWANDAKNGRPAGDPTVIVNDAAATLIRGAVELKK